MEKKTIRRSLFAGVLLAAFAAGSMGMMLEQQFGSVKGRVTGPDGQPVADSVVRLVASGPVRGNGSSDGSSRGKSSNLLPPDVTMLGKGQTMVSMAKTDANGYYEMKKVPTGGFKLVTNQNARFKAANVGVNIEADKTATVDIKLEASGK